MRDEIREHFRINDPVLYSWMQRMGDIQLQSRGNPFRDLCESIVSQQLSDKAGAAIWKKFAGEFGGDGGVTPEAVLSKTKDELRNTGMSWSKVEYVKNAAEAFVDGIIVPEEFPSMSDEDIKAELNVIKGVGEWTAEMFLMFSLGREDVVSFGDLGLKNAVAKVYGIPQGKIRHEFEMISEKWRPFRTYACLALWRVSSITERLAVP